MNTIHLSYNEILLTSQKVFEGLGYSVGAYEDAAATIAWLELHNLETLNQTIDELHKGGFANTEKQPSGSRMHVPPFKVLASEGGKQSPSIVIDSDRSHLLVYGPMVVDYVAAEALHIGSIHAAVTTHQNGFLLLPSLVSWAKKGMEILLRWHEVDAAKVVTVYIVHIHAYDEYPRVVKYGINEPALQEPDMGKIEIWLANHDEADALWDDSLQQVKEIYVQELDDKQRGIALTQLSEQRPELFKAAATENLHSGIQIKRPLWQTWTLLAKAVLVEATEESRQKGAGEQASQS